LSKADRNEQIGGEIPEPEADILRADDIMPPHKKKTGRKNTREVQVESASAQQEKTEIPKFDLAEEIMAEQRKITAIRRTGPGERKQPENEELKAEPAGYIAEQPVPAQSYEQRIIAEIVARDIERLCRGD